MVGLCTVCHVVCYDGVMLMWYCVLWRCTVCHGGVLCVRSVYCLVGLCTVCHGGVLRGMVMYCMLWWCTVW